MSETPDESGEVVFREKLREIRQWGKWGESDQRGAVNLITPDKIIGALALARLGETVTLSRIIATGPSPINPYPAQHFMEKRRRGENGEGSVVDYLGFYFHGKAITHIDALCHVWNHDGMWNGRDPHEHITYHGVTWGDIDNWKTGIITRGVLLDVARYRDEGFVERGRPVTNDELVEIARREQIDIEPGDALLIHSGREAWDREHDIPWGAADPDGIYRLPGLDATCLEFFASSQCSTVLWDMMDEVPNPFGVPHSAHAAINSLGVALLDNALLEPLARRCRELNRTDFLLVISPLRVSGGTGSPVNPLAIL